MPADEPRIGIHLALAAGMIRAADRAAELGLTTVQVFGDNPIAWRTRAEPSPELPVFRERLERTGIAPVAIHAAYLINPAGANPMNRERSIELLAVELASAGGFGATIVNVHVGSHGGAGVRAGVASIVEVLSRARRLALDAPVGPGSGLPVIALENSAGGGFGMGVDVDELGAIADGLDAAGLGPEAVGFCLDAAHAWGAGIDMADPAAIDDLLEAFDRRIGLGRLRLVHLNDSATGRGSRMDRHQHVGAGRIGPVGLGHLVRHERLRAVPFILETPGMDDGYDRINVERVRMLLRGEELPILPPEALSLPGSRTRAATPRRAEAGDAGPLTPAPVGTTGG